jgi:hypothetical protein
MAHPTSFVAGASLGAGLMYFLDPDAGASRRSLIRDQIIDQANGLRDGIGNMLPTATSEGRRTDLPSGLDWNNWSPTTRAAVAVAGVGIMATRFGRRSAFKLLLSTAGARMLASVLFGHAIASSQGGGSDPQVPSAHDEEPGNGPAVKKASSPMQAGEPVLHGL